ncbi:hypothetical protein VTN00DRAFT_1853 [Thermoascus crustaceus]|uniref:uncharacterized protein n=1 Tax=Thermoascus crustaceus TaxID=5088 RepID=UPI003742B98D
MKLFNVSVLTLLLLGTATATPVSNKPVKRAISNLPTAEVDCGGQKFNDFQIEDAAQRGVDNGLNPNGPQPGNKKPLDLTSYQLLAQHQARSLQEAILGSSETMRTSPFQTVPLREGA